MENRKLQTIVITDLDKSIDLQTLLNHFKQFGTLSGLKIVTRIRQEQEQSVAFVLFNNAEDAQLLMSKDERKTTINGKEYEMEFAKTSRGRRNDAYGKAGFYRTKLFVTGIPKDYDETQISTLLGKCKLFIPKDAKGYCFADYFDESTKNEAITRLDGKMLDNEHYLKLAPAFYGKRDEKKGEVKRRSERREKILD
ncbi:Polyadenylate-binding protein 4 [Binucleata daphniae]